MFYVNMPYNWYLAFSGFLGQGLAFFGENRLTTMLLIVRAEVSRLNVALTEAN